MCLDASMLKGTDRTDELFHAMVCHNCQNVDVTALTSRQSRQNRPNRHWLLPKCCQNQRATRADRVGSALLSRLSVAYPCSSVHQIIRPALRGGTVAALTLDEVLHDVVFASTLGESFGTAFLPGTVLSPAANRSVMTIAGSKKASEPRTHIITAPRIWSFSGSV